MDFNLKWTSNVKVTVRDLDGNIIDVQEFHNLITTVGLNMVRDALHAVADIDDCEIKAVEVGTSDTAPALTDTTLGASFLHREAIIDTAKPADGQTWCMAYFAPADAIGLIEEIAWFAGALANGQDTGIMISRVLYTRNKTTAESLQIERTDTIAEA